MRTNLLAEFHGNDSIAQYRGPRALLINCAAVAGPFPPSGPVQRGRGGDHHGTTTSNGFEMFCGAAAEDVIIISIIARTTNLSQPCDLSSFEVNEKNTKLNRTTLLNEVYILARYI